MSDCHCRVPMLVRRLPPILCTDNVYTFAYRCVVPVGPAAQLHRACSWQSGRDRLTCWASHQHRSETSALPSSEPGLIDMGCTSQGLHTDTFNTLCNLCLCCILRGTSHPSDTPWSPVHSRCRLVHFLSIEFSCLNTFIMSSCKCKSCCLPRKSVRMPEQRALWGGNGK